MNNSSNLLRNSKHQILCRVTKTLKQSVILTKTTKSPLHVILIATTLSTRKSYHLFDSVYPSTDLNVIEELDTSEIEWALWSQSHQYHGIVRWVKSYWHLCERSERNPFCGKGWIYRMLETPRIRAWWNTLRHICIIRHRVNNK